MFRLTKEQFSEFLKNKRITGFAKLRYPVYSALEKSMQVHNVIPVTESGGDKKAYCYVDFIQSMRTLHSEKQAMRLIVRFQLNLVGTSIVIEDSVNVFDRDILV